ncbi:hypothetical protein ABZY02_30230 [Streptomyces sp. NPDC006649]|uniref:hypothetical protein n=1 Tax=unclassified Streptomyces TaxID=2593676 RepID=UPI0032486327
MPAAVPRTAVINGRIFGVPVAYGGRMGQVHVTNDGNAGQGASLTTGVNDGIKDIVAGREPVSACGGPGRTRRSGGGDRIRAEFEMSIALTTE